MACRIAWLTVCSYQLLSKGPLGAVLSGVATVNTKWVASATLGQDALVCIDVQTSVGSCAFPFSVEDKGSDRANEHQARRELMVFLQEALQALGEL